MCQVSVAYIGFMVAIIVSACRRQLMLGSHCKVVCRHAVVVSRSFILLFLSLLAWRLVIRVVVVHWVGCIAHKVLPSGFEAATCRFTSIPNPREALVTEPAIAPPRHC